MSKTYILKMSSFIKNYKVMKNLVLKLQIESIKGNVKTNFVKTSPLLSDFSSVQMYRGLMFNFFLPITLIKTYEESCIEFSRFLTEWRIFYQYLYKKV